MQDILWFIQKRKSLQIIKNKNQVRNEKRKERKHSGKIMIIDVKGNKINSNIEKDESTDEYTQTTLKAIENLREMLTTLTSDLDLTFFQILGAVTSLQAQLVSTLMQREHLQMTEHSKIK